MLGNFNFPRQNGAEFVSKVVTTAIATLFKKTGKLEANIRVEPISKLLQGSIDGFDLIGNGMLMYNGLRIEAMELYFQAVSIDFSRLFSGKLKLRQPTKGSMRVVLSEQDLASAFKTPFILEKLERLKFQEKPVKFDSIQLNINQDKSLQIKAQIRLVETKKVIDLDLKADLELENRTKIQFINLVYQEDKESLALGKEFINHVNNLLDLDQFALEGTRLRVDKAKILKQQFIFYGVAEIDRFPEKLS